MRRVTYITGSRADYGLFSEPLKRIREAGFELSLIVTGMHLDERFGSTVQDIENDSMPIAARVPNLTGGDLGGDQARSIGKAVLGITPALEDIKPEVVIVLGDRGEMLAAAIAATHLNRTVAHVHGGEVSGTVDELVRHAISKLAHVHFAATEDAAERLRRMGERPEHVHVVGAPGLDYLSRFQPLRDDELAVEAQLDLARPFVIFTQHPVTIEMDAAASQMETSLEALEAARVQVVATYPNSDAGGRAMIKVLERWQDRDWLHIVPSLGQRRLASLMKRAAAMVGNSSSGIIEAPFFGLPVINIGTRQEGRLRAGNVVDVPYDRKAISTAIECALTDKAVIARARGCKNPYGDGHAGERIVEVLKSLELGPALLDKRLTF